MTLVNIPVFVLRLERRAVLHHVCRVSNSVLAVVCQY